MIDVEGIDHVALSVRDVGEAAVPGAKVTITNVPDKPGVAAKIFNAIADANLVIDMIVQNVSVAGTTDISFTLNKDELSKVKQTLNNVVSEIDAKDLIA